MHRQFVRHLFLAIVLLAWPAAAQFTRDAAGTKKIDEAINTHYLATDFDKAEAVLTGTIKACEDKCSPQTLAKAWMYVGIVRGSGRNDQAGAKEAFAAALALDATVKLDAGLATPETQATFQGSSAGGAAAAPAAADSAPTAEAPAAGGEPAAGEGLSCTPAVTQVETRRPVPVQCRSDEEVTSLELRYKAFGADTWKTLKMERKGKSFRSQVPCDATQTSGVLKLYVQGKDAQGDSIVNWGNKNQPIEIQLAEESTEEPPSFDDADAPPRCAAKEICPPDFPGCDSGKASGGTVDWGGSCNNSTECKAGLLCTDGTCETAPSCTSDADCSVGTCVEGKCAVATSDSPSVGPLKKWWFGFHVAQDWAFVGGDQVCMAQHQQEDNFACYNPNTVDQPYDTGFFNPSSVGAISSGAVLATTRFLLSVDHALTPNMTVGGRVGFAIRGGPPANRKVTYAGEPDPSTGAVTVASVQDEGTSFLPIHVEARFGYWFGSNALAKKGIRPYVHAGGGMAQVDARVVVRAQDMFGRTDVDAWKKLGQGFITLGGGAVYAFTPSLGLQLNLNGMYMLTASGLVLEPSLGLVLGL